MLPRLSETQEEYNQRHVFDVLGYCKSRKCQESRGRKIIDRTLAYRYAVRSPAPVYPRGYPLLVVAIASIEAYPDHHQQSEWSCRTGLCAGGWVCVQGGERFARLGRIDLDGRDGLSLMGATRSAPVVAAWLLGVERYQEWLASWGSSFAVATDWTGTEREWDASAALNEMYDGNNSLDDIYYHGAAVFDVKEKRLRADVQLILACAPPEDAFEREYLRGGEHRP